MYTRSILTRAYFYLTRLFALFIFIVSCNIAHANNTALSPTGDDDQDSILNSDDNCPTVANTGQWDRDKDGLGNECDDDIDGDGYSNEEERLAGSKMWDFQSRPNQVGDKDADGILDQDDNCPDIVNAGQWDKDKDGLGNECDDDIDGDSFSNEEERLAGSKMWDPLSRPVQAGDKDSDRILDADDNCPNIANAGQWDKDKDGLGNECDDDIDGDGFTHVVELSEGTKAWDKNSFPTVDTAPDSDEDGIADNKDNCPETANTAQTDTDNNGIGDACQEQNKYAELNYPTLNKYYRISSLNSNNVMQVASFNQLNGAIVSQSSYTASQNQQWLLVDEGEGNLRLKPRHSDKYLDIDHGSVDAGRYSHTWQQNESPSQLWKLDHVEGNVFKVRNNNSGLLLSVADNSTASGAQIIQWSDHSGPEQLWRFDEVADNQAEAKLEKAAAAFDINRTATGQPVYKIRNEMNNTYLFEDNGQVSYGNDDTPAYYWQLTNGDNGVFNITNLLTKNTLHIENQTGRMEISPAHSSWLSAMWYISETGGDSSKKNFRSRWQENHQMYINSDSSAVVYGEINSADPRSRWTLVQVNGKERLGRYERAICQDLAWTDPVQWPELIRLMNQAKIKKIRLVFRWPMIEPERGVYEWGVHDELVDLLLDNGIEIVGQVMDAPSWANGKTDDNVPAGHWAAIYRPLDHRDWERHLTQVASRYKDKVRKWIIWNEPNLDLYWRPNVDVGSWVYWLGIGSNAIRAADPSLFIITGGITGHDPDYIRAMYAHGAKGLFDALSIHPYTFPGLGLHAMQDSVNEVRDIMAGYQDNSELWVEEVGWSYATNGQWGNPALSDAEVAKFLRHLYMSLSGVDEVFWYNLKNMWWADTSEPEGAFGLVSEHELTPFKTYDAMALPDREYIDNIPIESFDITQPSTALKLGESLSFAYELLPTSTKIKHILWQSSDNSIATVDANGKVNAVGTGEVTITGKTLIGELSDSIKLTIAP